MSASLYSFESSSSGSSADMIALQSMSDDECVERLTTAMDTHMGSHDESRLGELAALISRLAVPIEL